MMVPLFSTTINIPENYPTIQEGIDVSVEGDTVLIAQGTYYENLILEKEIVLASHAVNENLASDWFNNENIQETIISGAQEPIDPNKGSCLIVRDGNIQPTIIGLTFKDGVGTSILETVCSTQHQKLSGGGILIYKAYPTIMYNRFIDNGYGTDNLRAGKGSSSGGAISFYAGDDVEFDEDRSFSNHRTNSTRDIPDTLNITNNYFDNNASGDGKNFYSQGYEGLINVSNSIFDDIDCGSNSVNEYVLKSRINEADYLQNDISGNCIEGSSFYVSVDGDNNNPGTESHPLKTIGHALSLVRNDSTITTTIYIDEGIYSPSINGEQFPIVLPDNIHLIGENRENSILDAEADIDKQSRVIVIDHGVNIIIENFTITGGYHTTALCVGGGGILIGSPHANYSTATPVLKNLIVSNNHAGKGGGIFTGIGTYTQIKNSKIIHNSIDGYVEPLGSGIAFWTADGTLDKVLVSSNSSTSEYDSFGISTHSSNLILNKTTISRNQGGGGFCGFSATESGEFITTFINSLIHNNDGVDVLMYDMAENYAQGNLFYSAVGTTSGNVEYGEGSFDITDNMIVTDVDGFTLLPLSVCIDAGTAYFEWEDEVIVDIYDNEYVGSAPDIGAFEFGAVYGCTDPAASNYDPSANMEDGSCVFGATELTLFYSTGWNMVGLPLEVEDPGYQTLFPSSQEGTLYSFADTYQEQNDLNAGNGYLLRMISDDSVTFTGSQIYGISVALTSGWNLFSGTSSSLSVEDIYANDIIYQGTIYGLDANYYNPESIEPGRGYWVRATEDGEITLVSDGLSKAKPFVNRVEAANTILFSTDNHSAELYFGVDVPEEERLSYSLPPKFPKMAFDARFSGDMKLVPESGLIELITHSEMVTIKYDIKIDAGERMSWFLRSGNGEDNTLEGSGEIILPSSERFILNKESVIPVTFVLHQNFPNPFNPITTLRYDLPSDALVTLSIYDMLGKEITQLVNTTQQAGFKSVKWDATDSMGKPVSAGVYLYQIQAGEFVQTKKMVLLK